MHTVKAIYRARTQEIEAYYTFLESYIRTEADKELSKILRSNLLLMLYNLVESTVANAIEAIHNDIHAKSVSFDSLNQELQKVLIKQLKNNISPHDFVLSINSLALDVVKKCFQKKKISNGNIDNTTINKLAREYGFNFNTTYDRTKHGKCLEEIRGRRNDLAHGTFSFTEIGKEYTIEDLEKKKDETINYLSEILDNIDIYLTDQSYIRVF